MFTNTLHVTKEVSYGQSRNHREKKKMKTKETNPYYSVAKLEHLTVNNIISFIFYEINK